MNKKVLNIVLVVAGVSLLVYMYNRSKKKTTTKTQEKPQVSEEPVKVEMASEKDALEFMETLKKLGFMVRTLTTEYRKAFINEYMKDISKEEHLKVMGMLKKNTSQWTLEEEFFYKDKFQNGILTFDE